MKVIVIVHVIFQSLSHQASLIPCVSFGLSCPAHIMIHLPQICLMQSLLQSTSKLTQLLEGVTLLSLVQEGYTLGPQVSKSWWHVLLMDGWLTNYSSLMTVVEGKFNICNKSWLIVILASDDVTIQIISWKKIALLGSTDQSFFICWEVGVGNFEGIASEYTRKGGIIENWLPQGVWIIYSEYFCTTVQRLRGESGKFQCNTTKILQPSFPSFPPPHPLRIE